MQAAASAGTPRSSLSVAEASPAGRLGVQGIVLGIGVAVLLFLVGYPLLWLILGGTAGAWRARRHRTVR